MRNRSKSLHARHQPLDSEDEDIFDNGTQEFNPSSCITNKRNTDGKPINFSFLCSFPQLEKSGGECCKSYMNIILFII